MRVTRLIGFVLASLLPAFAQPDAASLIRKSATALNGHSSYQYTEEMTVDVAMPGGISMTTVVRGVPGKLRRDTKASGIEAATVIFDGESAWVYMPMTKGYAKVKAGSPEEAAWVNNMDFGSPDAVASHAKVVRSETLEVDGQPHDCWVVEARLEHPPAPAQAPGALRGAVVTYWIDKSMGLDLQMTLTGAMDGAVDGKAAQIQSKTTKHALQFDIPLADSLFKFTPPEGATETASLIPGAGAPAARKAPEKATAPPAAPVSNDEARAFVPSLNPIERVEPVLPAAAKATGLQGVVEVLVTINPGGRVVNTEALTGPQGLRQAALDAVKQWRFRPVIRDGRPVSAYTVGMVDFFDPEKSPTFSGQLDMADEMKGAERRMALQARFPRTPEQVLADAEQDVGGASAQNRSYALPELAKTAVDAGALEKATSYANEILQRAADTQAPQRDWNYGNEIYTGNMVLGLVALRQDNIAKARQYLLESAKTPGSPTLGSFGPDLQLAGELLKKGEKDAVLEFLEACRSFWKSGGPRLDALMAKVRAGGALQLY
jgi:TonB family protein